MCYSFFYNSDPTNPRLALHSYLKFYYPLSRLLINGWRKGDPSQPSLVESCLQSIQAFDSYMENLLKRGKNRSQLPKNIPSPKNLIPELEALLFPRPMLSSAKVSFYLPEERPEGCSGGAKLKSNIELHEMISLNKKIKSFCTQELENKHR